MRHRLARPAAALRRGAARTAPAVHTATEALSDLAGWVLVIIGTTWALGRFGVDLAHTAAPDWLALTTLIVCALVWLAADLTEPTTDDEPDDCC